MTQGDESTRKREQLSYIMHICVHHVILHMSYKRVKHNKRGGSDGRHTCIQGGRSCAKARRAFAEKLEIGQKF